jgi:PAS domain-containing protein
MFQLVLDTIPQRVFWKDTDSVYVGCNAALAHDAGFDDPSQLIGLTDYDMSWKPTADRYRADDHEVMETGSAASPKQPRPQVLEAPLVLLHAALVPGTGRLSRRRHVISDRPTLDHSLATPSPQLSCRSRCAGATATTRCPMVPAALGCQ